MAFKLAPDGVLTVLHAFTGGSDGAGPSAGLILDGAGDLYGTTYAGGSAPGYSGGNGVVFKLAPPAPGTTAWTETVLHVFAPGTTITAPGTTITGTALVTNSDGALPLAGLVADSAGNLYGTTQTGGASGQGVVFKLSGTGTGTGPALLVPPLQVAATASGLAYSRVSQTFNGSLTLTNTSAGAISGPVQILFTGLTPGVTLANATGSFAGTPYLTVPALASLPPFQSVTLSVQFKNPSNALINFTPAIYSGSF